jgi:hypothetical protein
VFDPHAAGALATSSTGAVVESPPTDGSPWVWEAVPEVDHWPATEALAALNADDWHADGVTGAGVKVAVFDLEWFGAEADPDVLGDVETHDCWSSPTCAPPIDTLRPRFGYEEGVHGFACAQVVHDVAPDAELHLVRVNGQTTLDNAVDWAIRNDVDVVSMSLSFFNQSFGDGSGAVNAQIERLRDAGVQMVASAGNAAYGHRLAPWTDGNADGRLDFDGDDALLVHLNPGRTAIYVSWNQYRSCGITDLDVFVRDADGDVLARGMDVQDPDSEHCEPMERVAPDVDVEGWYRLEVDLVRGSTAGLTVRVMDPDGTVSVATPGGSVADPASSSAAFTVGAVRATGYLDNGIEGFSSQGPTTDGRPKPDIAGPDGLSTEAYGSEAFYGTSASTPAVAGAIALVMSADPSLSSREAADRLQGWALGDSATWEAPDPAFGAGKARLPVDDGDRSPCGRQPLLLPLAILPFGWIRRRLQCRRTQVGGPCGSSSSRSR